MCTLYNVTLKVSKLSAFYPGIQPSHMVAIGYQSRDRNIFWDVGRSGFSMGCCRVYWHGSSSRNLEQNIFWVMRQLYLKMGISGSCFNLLFVFIFVLVLVFVLQFSVIHNQIASLLFLKTTLENNKQIVCRLVDWYKIKTISNDQR